MKSEKPSFISLKKEIKKLLKRGVSEGVFPAAAAGIFWDRDKEKKIILSHYGNASIFPATRPLKKNNYFDLASLSKPLATTMAILCLIKEEKIDIDEIYRCKVGKGDDFIKIHKQLLDQDAIVPVAVSIEEHDKVTSKYQIFI